MYYYHVRVKLREPNNPIYLSQTCITEVDLLKNIVDCYLAKSHIILNGIQYEYNDITKIFINRTNENRYRLKIMVQNKIKSKQMNGGLPLDWNLAMMGNDVTNDFLGEKHTKKESKSNKKVFQYFPIILALISIIILFYPKIKVASFIVILIGMTLISIATLLGIKKKIKLPIALLVNILIAALSFYGNHYLTNKSYENFVAKNEEIAKEIKTDITELKKSIGQDKETEIAGITKIEDKHSEWAKSLAKNKGIKIIEEKRVKNELERKHINIEAKVMPVIHYFFNEIKGRITALNNNNQKIAVEEINNIPSLSENKNTKVSVLQIKYPTNISWLLSIDTGYCTKMDTNYPVIMISIEKNDIIENYKTKNAKFHTFRISFNDTYDLRFHTFYANKMIIDRSYDIDKTIYPYKDYKIAIDKWVTELIEKELIN